MAKQKTNDLKLKTSGKAAMPSVASGLPQPTGFAIRYPLLWLAAAVIIVYFPTFSMGLTDLDDGIIINSFKDYNENLHNLITSFSRSAFGTSGDVMYRPVPADIMILNYHIANHGENIMSYHVINVLCHLAAVVLLYKLFRKLEVKELHAFILTLVFAVHPAISQAVAWIPARNETLLAIFTFSFLLFAIDYVNSGKLKTLLLSTLFLLLAFFSKETAVFAAPAAFFLIVFGLKKKWTDKRLFILYPIWMGCFIIWVLMRSAAIAHPGIQPAAFAHDFLHRLPLTIQYIGKMFLPFNLSVFPSQEDTVYYYGFAAITLLALSVFLYKRRDWGKIWSGFLVFFLFLVPVLFLPASITEQTFEYRMYLPMAGIFFVLPQTAILQNKLNEKQLLASGIAVACLFALLNFRHQQNFATPLAFWTQAVETTPHSAEANMRLAARIGDEDKSRALFLKAFAINPKEPLLNFIYGVMLQNEDSMLASEKYFLIEKTISNYYQCDLYLSQVAMKKNDKKGAIAYLESYIVNDKNNKIANDNLLLLYLDTDQDDKAKAQAKHMLDLGLDVPQAVRQHFQL